MTYFDLLKNATRRTRFLLVFLMSLIGLSAAAGTYYADLNVAVNPADLDEGDMVVMCHVNSKAFVGYDGSNEQTTTHVKTSDQNEANAFVYTVKKDGYKVALTNGFGYGPRIANRVWGFNFTYSWSKSPSSFTVESTGGTTRLYVTAGLATGYLSRTDKETSYSGSKNSSCDWKFYRVYEFDKPTLVLPVTGSKIDFADPGLNTSLTSALTVKGVLLTKNLTVSVTGEGFSIDRTSISAADANSDNGAIVNVTFKGSKYKFYSGTLTITNEEGISASVKLSAKLVNPDDILPTSHNQLKAWNVNTGAQEVGYIGLGNKNQVLASACVSISSAEIPAITYRLFGNTEYLSAVGVYARKRDTNVDYTPDGSYAKFENTFAHLFDYRNPEKNCGAIFLGFTHDVPAAGKNASFTSNVKLEAGEYVIYLVANTKTADEIGGIDKLPLIGGSSANFTHVGGVIKTVICGTTTATIESVNNYSQEGGGRVIVPKFELLYAPKYGQFATSVEYSKYYRIPAITRASDGTLVALSDARKNHIHDVTNNIDVVSRRSVDNGKTWSDYVVIFQGSAEGTDCYNWKGYGDAAVASFPNGTVMATAIHGFGLGNDGNNPSNSKKDPGSDVVWKVSRNNGKTWSSEYTLGRDLYGGMRGNISPGNLCVAKSGFLKGKAVAALRTTKYPNNGYSYQSAISRIYCVAYDPDNNSWTKVALNGTEYISDGELLDEAQFLEMGENDFILSVRYTKDGDARKFYRVHINSATSATATAISQTGMKLKGGCNGDLITYKAKNGAEYILHTVPKDMVYTNDNCRTSLSAYYTTASTSGNLNWTRSIDLFDPFDNTVGGEAKSGIGAIDETAQYSSLAIQEDGTIGVLLEAYPLAIRHKDTDNSSYKHHWGDWVMGQYYINLRIGDLIPNAEQPEPVKIDAPAISPNSATFNSVDATDRPEITISHNNYETYAGTYNTTDSKVNTNYEVEYFDAEGKLVARANIASFDAASQSLTWEQVWKSLVKVGTTETYTADPTLNNKSTSVRVSAYCVWNNDDQVVSAKATQIYTFDTPVRLIKVVGLPTSGASTTTLATQGNSVGSDVWLTVGLDKHVHLNAPAKYPYSFVGFYYNYSSGAAEENQVPLSEKLSYTKVSGMEHQITFDVPSVEKLPDNYNSDGVQGLVIYAVYKVEAGFLTRVNTQYNNGVAGGNTFDSQYSYWTPAPEYQSLIESTRGGELQSSTLDITTPETQDNTHIGGTGSATNGGLTYPSKLNYGLDAYVTVVPDAKAAENLNAIVRVKKNGAYLPDYYVVNSYAQALFGDIVSPAKGCKGVLRWYGFSDGVLCPKTVGMRSYEVGTNQKPKTTGRRSIVEGGPGANGGYGAWYKVDTDIAFVGICKKAEAFDGTVEVEVYLVNNDITSVDQLNSKNFYIAKVTHNIVLNNDPNHATGVEDVNAEKTVAGVVYCNMLGAVSDRPFEGVNVVVTTYTDGTKSTKKILR